MSLGSAEAVMNKKDQSSPATRAIARRLLASAAGSQDPGDAVASTLSAYASVRGRFSQFLGPAGFDALMSRSLAIAATERKEFSGLRLDSEGIVQGLLEYAEGRPVKEVLAAIEDLLSNFIALLSTFIGDDLTQRLTTDIGPAESQTYYNAISREAQ